MRQTRKTFKKAGDQTMSQLLFYNPTLTKEELKFEAKGMAEFLDVVFKNTSNAKYEEGVNKAKAIDDMVDLFIDADKTMAELSEVVDNDYVF